MAREPSSDEQELRRLRAEAAERQHEMRVLHQREERQDALIAQLRTEVGVREDHLAELTQQLAAREMSSRISVPSGMP